MKYIPKDCFKSFLEIDFNYYLNNGFNTIISDLDNTLALYSEAIPNKKIINKINELKKLGFKIYLISNNNKKRVETFIQDLNIDGVLANSNKPFKNKLKKYLKKNNIDTLHTIGIGDQLLTDILVFNKLNICPILVRTLNFKKQKWYTKINRLREKRIIKKIKKENKMIGEKIEKICQDV